MPKLKMLKRFTLLGLAGFLAFAPPGTLILLMAFALGLLGKFWLLTGIGAVIALAAVWLVLNRRGRSEFRAGPQRRSARFRGLGERPDR